MTGWVGLDSLYLNVKYPKTDVFDRWFQVGKSARYRELSRGIAIGDLVLRGGAGGYRLSVWRGDARAYLTDQVDQVVGEGRGMGIWMQLGPKFLISHWADLHSAVRKWLLLIGVHGKWPIGVTRLDLAVDLPGLQIGESDLELFRNGWVGRSRMSSAFFDPESGELQSIYIGSRRSAVMLRIYDKVAQSESEGDLQYWREIWGGHAGAVTRVEWEVKPKRGGFEDLVDFKEVAEGSLKAFGIYLLTWGRLCEPEASDTNNRRWNEARLWQEVRKALEDWSDGTSKRLSRQPKVMSGVSEQYLHNLAGHLSGGMARLSVGRVGLYGLLKGLAKNGIKLDQIEAMAVEKAKVLRMLGSDGEDSAAWDGAPPLAAGNDQGAALMPQGTDSGESE
ncbi:MAG: hypothetical protein ACC700_18750 [Anaerolineales bacterium]